MAKILVIDDSLLSRRMAADAVREAGYEAIEAFNGQNGLDMFDEHHPDCVVVDLLMPVMTGQEFLSNLRKRTADVPVFVLTSDIQDASKAECESLGISGFLNKPVLGCHLVESIQGVLSKTKDSVV